MHAFTVNYKERDKRRSLVDVGFFVHGVPRPPLLCRLFGHRPVVDGFEGHRPGDLGARWVVCDRCAVRPEPQGSLPPARWSIGDRYTGRRAGLARLIDDPTAHRGYHPPGPWPARPTGALGGQLIVGDRFSGNSWGFSLKVGHGGSEHTLAADIRLGPIGALYLHTERFGSWLVRRLNPTDYQSKMISLKAHSGHLWWQLWADRDAGWSSKARGWAKWRNHSVQIDPRTIVFGPKRYSYEDVGDPQTVTVRLPHRDEYEVTVHLQRRTLARKRGWWKRQGWMVDWTSKQGIATKPGDRGRIFGSGQALSDSEIAAGNWPAEAARAIGAQIVRDRERYDWRPPVPVLVTAEPDGD